MRRLGLLASTLLVLLATLSLYGCMLVASAIVCDTPPSQSLPLMTASLYTGGSPPRDSSGARFKAQLHLTLYSDGVLDFYNGSYSWCRSLDSASLATIREALASLPHEPAGLPREHTRLLLGGGTVVWVDRQDPPASGTSLDTVAFWSPSLENADAVAKSLDAIFCTLEAAMRSGYRSQVTKNFSDFLAARGRKVPCAHRSAS